MLTPSTGTLDMESPLAQLTLYAPDITCEHCIATIERTANAVDGARFLAGDPEAKSFVVDVEGGAALDRLAAALVAEGYPLGDGPARGVVVGARTGADGGAHAVPPAKDRWIPAYRVTPTARGADVNYDCYCGCDAGFALDRALADPPAEGCCCGNRILVGRGAESRLRAMLDAGTAYHVDVQQIAMPWGQPLDVALAIPPDA